MAKESPSTRKVLRIGHRGASGHAPENTLVSIQKAINLKCDLVEVDVRRTRDGHLVLLHDEQVDRTTNGTGLVEELSLDEIKSLNAGQGQRIPTLDEALGATRGRVGIMLELKVHGIGPKAVAAVRRRGFPHAVIYASFLTAELLPVRRTDPKAATLALMEELSSDPITTAREAQATHLGLRWDTATSPFVEACHRARLKVFVYTVNEPRDIAKMRALVVDGIISDFPDRL